MEAYEKRIKEIKQKIEENGKLKISYNKLWERMYPKYKGIPKAISEIKKQGYTVRTETNHRVTDYFIKP